MGIAKRTCPSISGSDLQSPPISTIRWFQLGSRVRTNFHRAFPWYREEGGGRGKGGDNNVQMLKCVIY